MRGRAAAAGSHRPGCTVRGQPGGEATWGPPARAALRRLTGGLGAFG
ncbi:MULTISPECIES: hypothetical protein [unclassified Nocardiopsis]|nr:MULTISPECIES: hypothetical protein [unclassified Nocardiopsis]